MLTQQTLQTLRSLNLTGMAEAFAQQLEQPAVDGLSFEERFSLLVDREATYRENRRLERLLHRARLRQNACVEDIDYRHPRGLDKRQMASLAHCNWIRSKHNACITGPTGCGKTWLACALGNQACRQGLSVQYVRATRLFEELRLAHGDGSFAKRMARLTRVDLLILDDWGLNPLNRAERQDLLEIMEERYGHRSTLLTSQLPVDHWHQYINDATLADAILDRILNNIHKVQLKGESMRRRNDRLAHVSAEMKRPGALTHSEAS
jgi:DNA replication protein DnaC